VGIWKTVNSYFLGKVPKEQVIDTLNANREKTWFVRAELPEESDIPDHPEDTKWFREMSFKEDYIETLRIPTLILNGDADPWVDSSGSIKYWQRKNPVAETLLIRDANHYMLSGSRYGRYAEDGEAVREYTESLKKWISIQCAS